MAHDSANSSTSRSMQYAGLSLFVVAEAVIFVPLLAMASRFEGAIPAAGLMTGVIFAGLTLMVFTTRADFSWMGRYLCIAAMGALGFIVCSLVIGFSFGILFTSFMIVLACGYILYYTSNVMHHYRSDQYVAASLALFSSVALLFWYILQLVMSLSRD